MQKNVAKIVCIDCRYINGRPSGIAEMVTALAMHAPAFARDMNFRLLVDSSQTTALSDAPNVHHVPVRATPNGPATMWWLPHAADLRGIDLFHATFNIMPARLRVPCITTVHDMMWLDRPDWCETGWRGSIRRRFFAHGMRRALARSAFIATVSEATRSAIIDTRPSLAARTAVTRSGVSDAYRPVARDVCRTAALGLDPARRFVLVVGQYAPYKNHEGAVRAFALACVGRSDVDLVLVHRRGPPATPLIDLAAQLGVARRVRILAAVAAHDLVHLYCAAAVLLHPSFCEGFGNPVAEAMACGCPVITSDRSAMAEIGAAATMLIDPCDPPAIAAAIGTILDNPAHARTLRKRGLDRAAQLSWAEFARANVALYRRVLTGAGQDQRHGQCSA